MTMDLDRFVDQWKGPESLDYYHIDWIVKHVKQLERDIKHANNYIAKLMFNSIGMELVETEGEEE